MIRRENKRASETGQKLDTESVATIRMFGGGNENPSDEPKLGLRGDVNAKLKAERKGE